MRPLFLATFLLTAALTIPVGAAPPRVQAELSTHDATVGERVTLELAISTEDEVEDPTPPAVDGLEFGGVSTARQMSIINGKVIFRRNYSFTFVPRREGTFQIPPIEVKAGNEVARTASQTLKVGPAAVSKGAGDLAFGEIRPRKRAAWIGECIPLEIRFYLDAEANWGPQMPKLDGDGYTSQGFQRPNQRTQELAGKNYYMFVFNTVITPSKAGKLALGPAPMHAQFQRAARERSRYEGLFGSRFGPVQEMDVIAPAVDLEVKPLPVDGRPADFSGAIGQFEFSAEGTPGHVKMGEPVRMRLSVRGVGNFARISAPALVNAEGWQVYPATPQFESPDEFGLTGTKTFEINVVPQKKHTAMPSFSFSYFDPDTAVYKTITSKPAALVVEGEEIPAAPVNSGAVAATPTPTPPPAKQEDILGNLPHPAGTSALALADPLWRPFAVLFTPLPLLMGFAAWRFRKVDPDANRRNQLLAEKRAQLARVRSAATQTDLFDAAARVLFSDAALITGRQAAELDLPDLHAARTLPPSVLADLERLFAERAQCLYAGAAAVRAPEPADRERILATLAAYERSARR